MFIGILRVAEFFLKRLDKRPRIDGIQFFLIVQVHAGNVDGLEPFLDLALAALADVDKQTGVEYLFAVFLVKAVNVLLHPVLVLDGQFMGHEAAQACDALLSVKHLIFVAYLIKVDDP